MKKIHWLTSFFFLLKKPESLSVATVLALCATGGLYWNFSQWTQYRLAKERNEKLDAEQKVWLDKETQIDQHFQSVIDEIRGREILDEARLMDLVSNAAKNLRLKYSLGMPEAVPGKYFSFNKINIRLNDVYLEDILKFDDLVELPNFSICIDDMQLNVGGKKLSAQLSVSSLKIHSEENIDKLIANVLSAHHLDDKIIMWKDRKNLVE